MKARSSHEKAKSISSVELYALRRRITPGVGGIGR